MAEPPGPPHECFARTGPVTRTGPMTRAEPMRAAVTAGFTAALHMRLRRTGARLPGPEG
ncbi:hypothetical protein ACFV1G_34085 [Streptomyces anulatus]|uniref:hypothetical protein n=1 Tax=Streptomyces anulatus TaxID=1892 RepID=UPI0036B38BF3